jgi:3-phosphoshikimate 1-carboxyvinyltransferase
LNGGPAGTRTSSDPEIAVVRAAARLRGELRMPGDKSISHRALMLSSLAAGESRIDGAGDGGDVRSTAGIVRAVGAEVDRIERDGRTVTYVVRSPGAAALREPDATLDCGNSGTSLRLFTGLLAGLPITATLDGDESLRRRPVARIIEPLRSMGAVIRARQNGALPPVTVIGHTALRAIDAAPPVPSAQVKSAILLAGLHASGTTSIREAVATRDHTERMLRARGVDVATDEAADGSVTVSIAGGGAVEPIDEVVPGDVSAAAFWLVAAAIHPDAELTLRAVGVNPTRRAVIDILGAMGASIDEQRAGVPATRSRRGDAGEPVADLTVRSSALRAIDMGPRDVAAAIDEIPILCLAAACARGTTRIRGAGELRHKESDRLAGIASGLAALGARINVEGGDIEIRGGAPLTGAPTDSLDDHRLAMTFAIAALIARGETSIRRPASAAISYPGFFGELERVRA